MNEQPLMQIQHYGLDSSSGTICVPAGSTILDCWLADNNITVWFSVLQPVKWGNTEYRHLRVIPESLEIKAYDNGRWIGSIPATDSEWRRRYVFEDLTPLIKQREEQNAVNKTDKGSA